MLEHRITLDDVLCTSELARRPLRPTKSTAENLALHALARQISSEPESMLDTLMAVSLDLCGAGSAGVSLLETTPGGESIFRWVAVAGRLEDQAGETVPRASSPSGVCLDRGAPQLFRAPARLYGYLGATRPPIVETLVVPFCAGDVALGTVWIVTHDEERLFDVEDVRVMTSLASFTAAAFRVSAANKQLELLYSSQREYASKLQGLTEAAIAMNTAPSLQETLQILTEQARTIIGAHQAVTSIALDRSWSHALRAVSSDEGLPLPAETTSGATVCSLVCRTNQPVRFTQAELEVSANWTEEAESAGPRHGWLAAPLVGHDGRNLGVIQLADRYEGDFTGEDEAVLVQLAQMASSTIEKARLYAKVEESDRRKDEFLAMLSHELRNPLAAISNGLALVERRASGDANLERVNGLLKRQVGQMTRLLGDLLEVSRITSGKVKLQHRPLDLTDIVQDSVATVQPILEEHRHELVLSLPSEPIRMVGDPTRLEQVVVNLLNNAAKYTEDGGRIWLSMVREDEHAVISVRDNGIGIPPEVLPSLFDLFTQGERTLDRSEGGLGLGLTLVRSLVEMHRGEVSARSEGPGTGSDFEVRLPIANTAWSRARPRARTGERACAARALTTAPACKLDVLIVEDNVDAAATLAELVSGLGHEVRTVHDGKLALGEADQTPPDVVLLDIGLPGIDGYEVARRLRSRTATRGALLVALTGYGNRADRDRSRDAGFDGHLVKPVPLERLVRLLARHAQRVSGPERRTA